MNSLSWLLYGADLLGSLEDFLFLMSMLLFLACGAIFIARNHEYDAPKHWGAAWVAVTICPFLWLVIVLIPPKQTILMIAASEMGEAVVKTPEAQEVFGDLKAILKKQLEEMKK